MTSKPLNDNASSCLKEETPEQLLQKFIDAKIQEKTEAWQENYRQLAATLKDFVTAVQQSFTEIHTEISEIKKILIDTTNNNTKKSTYVA
jgi:vacuolar-type H+-ATPase subunit H